MKRIIIIVILILWSTAITASVWFCTEHIVRLTKLVGQINRSIGEKTY